MFDTKTGQPVEVPDDQAASAYASGALAPKKGDRVPVTLSTGEVGTVDAADLQSTIDAGGQIVSPEVVHRAELEEKYGGAGGVAGATGAGFARGLTVGLSDPVALGVTGLVAGKEAKESLRERLSAYKELHPYASAAGEVAGVVAPALLSGGAAAVPEGAGLAARAGSALGGAVRTAGVATEGVGMLGRLAERGASALVGEGAESLAGRVAQKFVTRAAGGAVEGALFGAGNEISEASLGDTQLTGEKLLASMGHGALMGGAVSGAAGAVGELGKAALAKASPYLRAKAEEQAWKAMAPLKKFEKEAEARAGGTRAVGRTLLEEGVFEGNAAAAPRDILPKVQERLQARGEELGAIMDKSGATIPARGMLTRISDVAKSYEAKAGYEPIAAAVNEYGQSLAEKLGVRSLDDVVPIRQAFEQRRALQDLVYKEARALDPKMRVEALREVSRIMSDEEVQAIDAAGKALGREGAGAELKSLRGTYQRLSLAEEALKDSSSRMVTNRNLSLSDYATAGAAAASGHPFAAPVLAVGHKVLRERGNAMAASYLDKLATISAIENRAAAVDMQVKRSLADFFAKAGGAEVKPRVRVRMFDQGSGARSSRDEYERRAADLAHITTQRQTLTDHVQATTAQLAPHAPESTKALAQAAQRGATFLASKLPKATPAANGVSTFEVKKPRPSDQEVATFLRYARAVDDPMSVLEDMKAGRLSREGVESLRAVYPSMYRQIQSHVMDRVTAMQAKGTPISYARRVELGTLLGIPTDWSLTPEGVQTLQEGAKAGDTKSDQQTPPSGPSRPVKTPQAMQLQTATERRQGGQIR